MKKLLTIFSAMFLLGLSSAFAQPGNNVNENSLHGKATAAVSQQCGPIAGSTIASFFYLRTVCAHGVPNIIVYLYERDNCNPQNCDITTLDLAGTVYFDCFGDLTGVECP